MVFNISKICLLLLIAVSTQLPAQTYHLQDEDLPCVEKHFNLYVHIVVDSMRIPIISEYQADSILSRTNRYFNPICMSFRRCELNIIENYSFKDVLNDYRYRELQILYAKPRRINVFFVETAPDYFCGKSFQNGFMEQDSAVVFIETTCRDTPAEQLAHHLGHLLGLEHTYSSASNLELVDGSNCETAGDRICDTPADPFGVAWDTLSNSYYDLSIGEFNLSEFENNCEFTSRLKDPNGEFFQPKTGNMMSPYPCKCGFSKDQFRKMVDHYNKSTFKHY